MLTRITRHRSRFITTAIAVAIVTAALLPGAWGTALAQTSGAPPQDEPSPTPTASPTAGSPTPTATTTTSTNPTTGTTTTTTTAADGTKTTETVRTDGSTATVVETPSGNKTTTVVVPNQGTVVVVEAPGQPPTVTVAPANPNTDTTMQLDVLGAQLSVPGGTLAADETIAIVEQSFNLAITLASTIDFERSSAAYVASIVNLASDSAPVIMPEVAAEPGTITGVRAFEISIAKLDGSTRALTNSIEMAWNFLPEHLAAAGGNFDNLLMLSFDPVTETWTQTTQLAQTTDSVTFEVTHSGVWAFAVRNATGAQAVPIPADTGTGIGETSDKTTAYLALAGVLAAIAVTSLGARAALRRTQG